MSDIDLIRGFIGKELLPGSDPIDDRDALLTSGRIDSLAVIRLVDFLERQFTVHIAPEAVTLQNFETLGAIDGYIAGLKS